MSEKTVVVLHITEHHTKQDFVEGLSKYGKIERIVMHVKEDMARNSDTVYAEVTFETEESARLATKDQKRPIVRGFPVRVFDASALDMLGNTDYDESIRRVSYELTDSTPIKRISSLVCSIPSGHERVLELMDTHSKEDKTEWLEFMSQIIRKGNGTMLEKAIKIFFETVDKNGETGKESLVNEWLPLETALIKYPSFMAFNDVVQMYVKYGHLQHPVKTMDVNKVLSWLYSENCDLDLQQKTGIMLLILKFKMDWNPTWHMDKQNRDKIVNQDIVIDLYNTQLTWEKAHLQAIHLCFSVEQWKIANNALHLPARAVMDTVFRTAVQKFLPETSQTQSQAKTQAQGQPQNEENQDQSQNQNQNQQKKKKKNKKNRK